MSVYIYKFEAEGEAINGGNVYILAATLSRRVVCSMAAENWRAGTISGYSFVELLILS